MLCRRREHLELLMVRCHAVQRTLLHLNFLTYPKLRKTNHIRAADVPEECKKRQRVAYFLPVVTTAVTKK